MFEIGQRIIGLGRSLTVVVRLHVSRRLGGADRINLRIVEIR
jgi:hypothetical protein